jgi:hypothetical protein
VPIARPVSGVIFHGHSDATSSGAITSAVPSAHSATPNTPIAASSGRGIGSARSGSAPGVRICRVSSSTTAGGKIAYSTSHAHPVTASMWKRSMCTSVTTSRTTPAIRYGAANARPRTQSRSSAQVAASVVEAQ